MSLGLSSGTRPESIGFRNASGEGLRLRETVVAKDRLLSRLLDSRGFRGRVESEQNTSVKSASGVGKSRDKTSCGRRKSRQVQDDPRPLQPAERLSCNQQFKGSKSQSFARRKEILGIA
jgi:hypothetical protein